MLRYSGLSPCCFVIALIYLERLKRREASVCLTSVTFQRLLLVAVMTAAKFLDDFYESNKHWYAQAAPSPRARARPFPVLALKPPPPPAGRRSAAFPWRR